MCLIITESWKQELKDFISGRKEITAYKIIQECNTSIYDGYTWKKGYNISSRPSSQVRGHEEEIRQINSGFHFYVSKSDIYKCKYAKNNLEACLHPYLHRHRRQCLRRYPCLYRYRVIELKIETKDIVAIGTFANTRSLVATKCYWDGEYSDFL